MGILLIPIVWILDQWTKKKVSEELFNKERIYYLDKKVSLSLVENKGAFLGLFQNKPILLHGLSILAIVVMLILGSLSWFSSKNKIEGIGYALILGGAIGNYTDRIKRGHVVDFIAFWPNHKVHFNLADFTIFKGVFILLFTSY